MAEMCVFCNCATAKRELVGETYSRSGTTVHQYCLYFASGLTQNGTEDEGIKGFLLSDIAAEVKRARRLRCKVCKLHGAPTGCSVPSCRQMGHIPCLLENGFLLHHHGNFNAYCANHCPKQILPPLVLRGKCSCSLCWSVIKDLKEEEEEEEEKWRRRFGVLMCHACHCVFHRLCVQKEAWKVGRGPFRCSVCGDDNIFVKEMLQLGVEIPVKYVRWEGVGPSSGERNILCCRVDCLCPDGRSFFTRQSKYRLKRCLSCNKSLGHLVCVQEKTCSDCLKPPSSSPPPPPSHSLSLPLPSPSPPHTHIPLPPPPPSPPPPPHKISDGNAQITVSINLDLLRMGAASPGTGIASSRVGVVYSSEVGVASSGVGVVCKRRRVEYNSRSCDCQICQSRYSPSSSSSSTSSSTPNACLPSCKTGNRGNAKPSATQQSWKTLRMNFDPRVVVYRVPLPLSVTNHKK